LIAFDLKTIDYLWHRSIAQLFMSFDVKPFFEGPESGKRLSVDFALLKTAEIDFFHY